MHSNSKTHWSNKTGYGFRISNNLFLPRLMKVCSEWMFEKTERADLPPVHVPSISRPDTDLTDVTRTSAPLPLDICNWGLVKPFSFLSRVKCRQRLTEEHFSTCLLPLTSLECSKANIYKRISPRALLWAAAWAKWGALSCVFPADAVCALQSLNTSWGPVLCVTAWER